MGTRKMPTESSLQPPASLDGPALADWAEAAIFIEERRRLSRSALRQRLRNDFADDVEFHLDLLFGEVARRVHLGGECYPFTEAIAGLVRRDDCDDAPYEFLLWLSVSPRYRVEKRFDEIDELFDSLVKHALRSYLGPGSLAVRFAHPSSDGRPRNFPEAIRWLAALLRLGVGPAIPRPRRKDGGVDVVAWRPFRDGRTGFLIILCQCTAQLNWPPKAKDIVVGQWRGWIDLGLNPLTALAVPFSVGASFDRWDEVRRTVHIVLDRLRLCELISSPELDPKYVEQLAYWSSAERSLLAISGPAGSH